MAAVSSRTTQLRAAEAQAAELFERISALGLIRAGRKESEVNDDVYAVAAEEFAVSTHWHKRIVRSGVNTLRPYDDNPRDLVIQDDDIVFIDLGPVFGEWEADFGRTYVVGDDPLKKRLVADGEACWHIAKQHFERTPAITAEAMFDHVQGLAHERGWEMGQWHSGHLIGDFPHDRPPEKVHNFIMPGNHRAMRAADGDGHPLEWILEVHFVDRERQIGAFFEQLLTGD